MFNFLKPRQPDGPNLVDEFWEQVGKIPSDVDQRMPTTWMMHHPLDVALDFTRRYLPEIAEADDPLRTFACFWLPTSPHRRDALMSMLFSQACWERTSMLPFTAKRRVLPLRIDHNSLQFTCMVSTFNGHFGMVGRFTNADLSGSKCRNRTMQPMVDGRWLPDEEDALTLLAGYHASNECRVSATVKLMQCMILTLLSPHPHMSFVIGFPELNSEGGLAFKAVSQLRNEIMDAMPVMEHTPQRPHDTTVDQDRKQLSQAMLHQRAGRIPRSPIPQPPSGATQSSYKQRLGRVPHSPVPQPTQVVYDDPVLTASVVAAISTLNDPAHGLSVGVGSKQCYQAPESPTYCRDDSPTTSDSGSSTTTD